MKPHVLLLAGCMFLFTACSTRKYVASTHPNGKPEVVLYLKGKGLQAEKVMEKVYYANGNLDHIGRFRDGKEHGEWTYYYEDGTRWVTEHWVNGLEEGVQIEYAPDGQVYLEKYYQAGRLIRTVDKSKGH